MEKREKKKTQLFSERASQDSSMDIIFPHDSLEYSSCSCP
jgi:hypothetical protein